MQKTMNGIEEMQSSSIFESPGFKDDSSKPDVDLVVGSFASALLEVSKVGTFGARKYSRDGWKTVEDGEDRYTSAMLRHYFDEKCGLEFDEESGLLHAAHLAWNALARLEFKIKEGRKE